jgi:DNA-binding protein HU-beta
MNKAEMIDHLAAKADLTKTQAKTAIDELFAVLENDLKKEGRASVAGFGTFTVTSRAARTGRNPQTGEALKIKASKSVRFKPSPTLKESVKKFKG